MSNSYNVEILDDLAFCLNGLLNFLMICWDSRQSNN